MSSPPFSPLLKNILLQTDDAALILPGIQVIYFYNFLFFSVCKTAFLHFSKREKCLLCENLFFVGVTSEDLVCDIFFFFIYLCFWVFLHIIFLLLFMGYAVAN
jgi:hypothetical protein